MRLANQKSTQLLTKISRTSAAQLTTARAVSTSTVFRPSPTPSLRSSTATAALLQSRKMSNWPKNISKENPLGLDDGSLFIQKGIINGKYVDAEDGKTFDVDNPATGKTIGTCPEMTVADIRKAVDTAYDTFKTFRQTTPNERQNILLKFYSLFQESLDDITRLIVWENGKSWNDAKAEAVYAASFILWFAGEAVRTDGKTIPCSLPGTRNFTVKQPVGVCALLVPWNFPAAMIARKIGPVLAVGCTAVIKVPAETPYTNLAIMELAKRAGVPDGVLNVVTCDKNINQIGEELTTNPKIKKVSFTGSTRVGKILAKNCSGTLKKMSLELGGNAPLIVFDDADIDTAVAGTIASKFRGSGQTCVCANRIYVQEGIYDKFAQALAEKVKLFKVGPGFDEGVTHGPLIHKRQADKVIEHIEDAKSKGAKVIVGGERGEGTIVQPTILTEVSRECLLNDEETFGPLAALIRFKTEDEAVELANNASVGLAGYFFSSDADRIWRVAERLEVGMVAANTGAISQSIIPFGGVKESGYGKEGAHEGTDEYCITKLVVQGTSLKNVGK
ncbi:succinate-semialdehyde dehydrogenase [Dioszegia hungarica]|uniref:succinate-semialdehyde dehydrogenase [NAD(P)(+)] n=1 Tax=Dioszegia hungarica TaxID=4972 RepID=A0AA38H7B7_9TREE|nr:succinate-semialdehyde dehydrogenase [Dioszegia hungarica]KAI9635468.1 succinate-semialdehyde dehydrogenase [Dioszegia hungarica]